MSKDANRLWELVVRYVYRKRGLNLRYQVMNPQASEQAPQTTQVPETSPIVVETSTNTTVTQAVNSTHYTPLPTSYYPQQCPPRYSYRSSGYQHSFAAYQECPINFDRPDYTSPPTRVQEVYNIYCMNDHANHVTRRAYEKGWISEETVKRIFHRGLGESFDG